MLRAALYCFLALSSTYAMESGASKSNPHLYLVLIVGGMCSGSVVRNVVVS